VVRRPLTDTALPPVPVNAEHGYVAPVPRFFMGTLLADYTADGDVGAVVGVSLYGASVERAFTRR
jgi:hypothetical protein